MGIHNALRRQVALLTRTSLTSKAGAQIRLLKKGKNLGC
jgi:hypothetical protein